MAFGPIQFGGLASGLDTASIINALLSVERNSVLGLEDRKDGERNKLSLIGSLEGMVKSLKKKADSLSGDTGFFSHNVSLSEEGFVRATLDGTATAGTHEIRVNALAQASRYHSSALADSTADLGTGTFSFDYDSQTYDIEITDASSSSLLDLADAINNQAGDIVNATVINTGPANNPSYELVLTGRNTGADHEIENISITDLDDQGTITFSQLQSAENSEFELDGISITRDSNVVSDLIQGYEFTLEQVHTAAGDKVVISAEMDTDTTMDNLQELVDEYNEIIDFVNSQNDYSEDAGPGGDLFGDFLLSQVRSTIYNGLFNVDIDDVMADTTGYSSLGLVGFDVGIDGTIEIDRTKMADKLAEDPTAFADLLTGDVEYPAGSGKTVPGAFGKLESAIKNLIDDSTSATGVPLEGIFGSRKDSINERIDLLDDQIEDEEYRIERLEESLVARFSALEQLLAGLQAQQQFLSA